MRQRKIRGLDKYIEMLPIMSISVRPLINLPVGPNGKSTP